MQAFFQGLTMDFFEVLEKRHSIRKFSEKKISPEIIEKLLGTVNSAPSAGNLKSYSIMIIKDAEKKQAIAKASFGQGFIASAPIVLVFFADISVSSQKYGERGKSLYAVQDATIAAAYIQLAATALGISGCWIGAFDEREISSICSVPSGLRPVAVFPLGFASGPEADKA